MIAGPRPECTKVLHGEKRDRALASGSPNQLDPGVSVPAELATSVVAGFKRLNPALRQRKWLPRANLMAASGAILALSLSIAYRVAAQPLDAVSREAATALAVAGLEAYEAGSYEDARDKLDKSYAVARVPTLGLWSARALYKLGLWLESEARYRETVALPLPEGDNGIQEQALADARTELERLTPTIPRLTIDVNGAPPAEVALSVDGKSVAANGPALRLDPGAHHVEAARGNARQSADVELAASDQRSIVLRLEGPGVANATPAHAPTEEHAAGSDWLRITGWSALAVGGVGIAVGTVAVVLAVQKKDQLDHDASCRANRCAPSERALVDSYQTRRELSTASFVAGGVLAVAGLGAVLLSGDSPQDARAEAFVSPGFTGVRGSF
jgi:hypothetical protein